MSQRKPPGRRFNLARRRHPWRPKLEVLEGRCLPSTVTTLADTGPGSLRDAIGMTPPGGTVDFQPGLTGTIALTSPLTLARDVTIAGPGAGAITVSGGEASQVFLVTANTTAVITGLSLTDGLAAGADGSGGQPGGDGAGGAVWNQGVLTLAGVIVSHSTAAGGTGGAVGGHGGAGLGGGLYNAGTLALVDCRVAGNTAAGGTGSPYGGEGRGGGLYSTGPLTLTGTTVADNTARGGGYAYALGGGIYTAGPLTLRAGAVTGNTAAAAPNSDGRGGGLWNSGTLAVFDSLVAGNTAAGSSSPTASGGSGLGGGLYNNATATLTDSTVAGNTAAGGTSTFGDYGGLAIGGGVVSGLETGITGGPTTVTLTDSTVTGNAAVGGGGHYLAGGAEGGGLSISVQGTLTVTRSTVAGNDARGSSALGGGLDVYLATLHLRSSVVAGNRAFTGPDLNGRAASADHNLLGDGSGSGGVTDGQDGNQVGTAGSPIEPRLGPLQDNGGLTPTMALLPGSPAIDTGDNTDAPLWDQRGPGFPRIVNGTIDIGAFEVQAHAHGHPTGQPLPDPLPVSGLLLPADAPGFWLGTLVPGPATIPRVPRGIAPNQEIPADPPAVSGEHGLASLAGETSGPMVPRWPAQEAIQAVGPNPDLSPEETGFAM